MSDDRNTRFVRFIFDLETRLRDWLKTSPEDRSDYMFRRNVRACDRTFQQSDKLCNAPGCRYPLRNDGTAESLPFIGDVCNLCYFMYHIVAARKFFTDAQRQDDENNPNKKRR